MKLKQQHWHKEKVLELDDDTTRTTMGEHDDVNNTLNFNQHHDDTTQSWSMNMDNLHEDDVHVGLDDWMRLELDV